MFDLETSPLSPMAAPLQADQLPTFKRGGMFGGKSGGIGEMIAAAINGYLAAGGNPAGQYGLQMLNQRRMMAQRQQQEDQQYQQQREDKFNDWRQQYDYQLSHEKPVNNDTENDYNYILKTLGKDAADQFLRTKTNPIVMTPMGPMPYSAVNPSAPQAPVGKLTPINEGGPGQAAPGGFPGGY